MENRWCSACGRIFLPRPQAPRQAYCSNPECQKERRRLWQEAKRRSDPDYAGNQRKAQQRWVSRNPTYWQRYRTDHPEYSDRNRNAQRERNKRKQAGRVAKMDDWQAPVSLENGLYELRPHSANLVAKMGVWLVRLTLVSIAP